MVSYSWKVSNSMAHMEDLSGGGPGLAVLANPRPGWELVMVFILPLTCLEQDGPPWLLHLGQRQSSLRAVESMKGDVRKQIRKLNPPVGLWFAQFHRNLFSLIFFFQKVIKQNNTPNRHIENPKTLFYLCVLYTSIYITLTGPLAETQRLCCHHCGAIKSLFTPEEGWSITAESWNPPVY